MKEGLENLCRLASNISIFDQCLASRWERDPRDGKAWECLHFDEYCFDALKLDEPVEAGLFSSEAAVKAALKSYLLYVVLYDLGLIEEEVDKDGLEKVKLAFNKLVDEHWNDACRVLKKESPALIEFMERLKE